MLDFANRPPQKPEDVSFSEAGRFLLADAAHFQSATWDRLDTLGRAACIELIDAFGGSPDPETDEFNAYRQQVIDCASEILKDEIHPFINGVTFVERAFRNQGERVTA